MIQRDERAFFRCACLKQRFILCATQSLISDCRHVVAGRPQKLNTSLADVFIKLELHATFSVGTGMMRSRAASAP